MAIGFTLLGSGGHLGVGGGLLEGHPVGSTEHLPLAVFQLTEVPLGEHEIPQDGGRHEEVERDEEREGPGSVGQLAVDTHDVETSLPEKLSSELTRGEPAAHNVEQDAEDQHHEESSQSEEEAGEEVGKVPPSIPDSVPGLHHHLLEGQRLGFNILRE